MSNKIKISPVKWQDSFDDFLGLPLQSELDKVKNLVKKGEAYLYLVSDLGFIVVKKTDKYFDLLAGIKSPDMKNVIEEVIPEIMEYTSNRGLIFRLQTEHEGVKDKFITLGFELVENDGSIYRLKYGA